MKYGFWSCGKSIHASTCFIWVVLIQDQSKPWHLVLLPPFQIGCMSDLIVPLSKCLYVWLECPPFKVVICVGVDCPPFKVIICLTWLFPFHSGYMYDDCPLSKWFYVWLYCPPFKVVLCLTLLSPFQSGYTSDLCSVYNWDYTWAYLFFFCCWPKGRDIFSFVYHKVF